MRVIGALFLMMRFGFQMVLVLDGLVTVQQAHHLTDPFPSIQYMACKQVHASVSTNHYRRLNQGGLLDQHRFTASPSRFIEMSHPLLGFASAKCIAPTAPPCCAAGTRLLQHATAVFEVRFTALLAANAHVLHDHLLAGLYGAHLHICHPSLVGSASISEHQLYV